MGRSVHLKNHSAKEPNRVKEYTPQMRTPCYLFTLDLRVIDLQKGCGVCQGSFILQSVPERKLARGRFHIGPWVIKVLPGSGGENILALSR